MDYYNISDDYNVFELEIPENAKKISLIDLNSPSRFGVNIILVSRDDKSFMPNKDLVLEPKDHIFIFGKEKGVFELESFLIND